LIVFGEFAKKYLVDSPCYLNKLYANVNRNELLAALRKMGPKFLHNKKMKEEYDVNNPTRNFCYVVSEFVYYYIAPEGSKPYGLRIEGDDSLHRFVKWPDGRIVDLTCDQFDDYSKIIYSNARVCYFLPVSGKWQPSKRARHLAELLGYNKTF
jgi:hypothetical protein